MYLEIYGNICVSEKCAQYIRKSAKKFDKLVRNFNASCILPGYHQKLRPSFLQNVEPYPNPAGFSNLYLTKPNLTRNKKKKPSPYL